MIGSKPQSGKEADTLSASENLARGNHWSAPTRETDQVGIPLSAPIKEQTCPIGDVPFCSPFLLLSCSWSAPFSFVYLVIRIALAREATYDIRRQTEPRYLLQERVGDGTEVCSRVFTPHG